MNWDGSGRSSLAPAIASAAARSAGGCEEKLSSLPSAGWPNVSRWEWRNGLLSPYLALPP